MHLTILSRSSAIFSTRRLVDAARIAGHRVRVLNPLKCEMHLGPHGSGLLYQRKPVVRTDVCLPRIAQSTQSYGLAVLDQLEQQGVPPLNGSDAIARSRSRLRCLQLLAANGIPVPATVLASEARGIKELVGLVGGCPVLIKILQGGPRQGVMVCETMRSMEAALEALLGMGHNVIVQQYVPDKGRDLRALVVGGRVVAAVRRRPLAGRLHRTLGAGARFEAARLKPEFSELAVRTARLVGLEVAAVDLLDLKEGPRVFEVNSSPGLKEIERITGVDAARAIIARAVEIGAAGRRTPPRRRGSKALSEKKPSRSSRQRRGADHERP